MISTSVPEPTGSAPAPQPISSAPAPGPANSIPGPELAISRAEYIDGEKEQVAGARARFLGVVHDIDFHHYTDAAWYMPEETIEDCAAVSLDVLDRIETAAREARTAIAAALTRRAYLASGAPLVCGNCDTDIAPEFDSWQVCTGWAEHTDCHREDPATEAQDRAWSVAEDEYSAYLHHRNHVTGPQAGDRIRPTRMEAPGGTWGRRSPRGNGGRRPAGVPVEEDRPSCSTTGPDTDLTDRPSRRSSPRRRRRSPTWMTRRVRARARQPSRAVAVQCWSPVPD